MDSVKLNEVLFGILRLLGLQSFLSLLRVLLQDGIDFHKIIFVVKAHPLAKIGVTSKQKTHQYFRRQLFEWVDRI